MPRLSLGVIALRLQREERGFSLVETMVALGVIFTTLMGLAYTATIGFVDIALARQRQSGNAVAIRIVEQVRGLSYATVSQGLADADLAGDPNIVLCPDGAYYFKTCPGADPASEKIVHTAGLPATVPLVPHQGTLGPPDYTITYSRSVYVTNAVGVPQSGAFRVTVIVSWSSPARPGARNSVQSQTLIYQPEGSTDSSTNPNPGGGNFFFGTGSLSRGSVTVTPNSGVTGGTGVKGLPAWDSVTQDLYSLDANVQQQTLAKSDGQASMNGARKLVGGVETISGQVSAASAADDDPATTIASYDAPSGLTQAGAAASVTGGGNSIEVGASGPAGGCPTLTPTWFAGWETGTFVAGVHSDSNTGTPTMDPAVKKTGAYSMKIAKLSGGVLYITKNGTMTNVMSFAFRFASLPTADVYSMAYFDGIGNDLVFGYKASTKKFTLRWGNFPVVEGAPTVTAGTWYTIDMRSDSSVDPFVGDWRIDGVDQPRPTIPTGNSATVLSPRFGSILTTDVFTAYYDDVVLSATAAEYPIGPVEVFNLRPNGMGNSVNPQNFQDSDGTPIDANSYASLTDTDWLLNSGGSVRQTLPSASSYLEMTFADTTAACIRGVQGFADLGRLGSQNSEMTTRVYDGATSSVVFSGIAPCGNCSTVRRGTITPASALWSASAVNGLVARLGYSNDVSPVPFWEAMLLEYLAPPGGGIGGPPGTETGSTSSTTSAGGSNVCGNPVQSDLRPCSYAKEQFTTSPQTYLRAQIDLAGSGAGKCVLSQVAPTTASGAVSYAYGRRTAGGGGAGTVKESVVRYNGSTELAQLCAGTVASTPPGWPGYYIKYDAGSGSTCAHAEAGIGSSAPTFCKTGTISYYNGSGVTSITQADAGGAISVAVVDWTNNGWRYEISGSLATKQSFTSQSPPGALGTADRTEARAVLGAPVTGTITYKLTNTTTGEVIVNVTLTVDLGTLTAYARHQP